jgi:hypothetical protein
MSTEDESPHVPLSGCKLEELTLLGVLLFLLLVLFFLI